MARLEEFDDVQLDVEFTQAGTRSNLTSKENIAISFGKIAKWYEALVPTGGSSGQFLGFNSSGTAKWVSNPNVDEKVKATKLAQSTSEASYYPTLVAGEGTAGVNIFDSAKINHTKGTTSAVGNTRLILGNATNEGTTNNEEGLLRIYSSGTKYHTLKGAKITTDNVDHTLPTTGGTILNTGTTSFTRSLSSGTKIGTIKINGTSSDIYAPTNTDTKVTDTVGTANTYYPAGGTSTSTATGTQVFDTSLKFIGTTGTTSAVGKAQLVLGNATASGTANNKQGSIVVYGSTAYAHTIQGAPTAARTLTLPDKTGTFALTSDIPTVNNAALTLKGAGTTVTTFTANASSAKSLDIVAGSNVTVTADATNAKISIASSHPTITKSTDTTSTASPAHGGTFTVVDSITREANGHVTKINTKTVTLPADSNTDTKVTQSATTTTNYRPILFGAKNSTDVSTLADTITDQAYTSTKMFAKPDTGYLYASGFSTSSYINGTGAQLAQYGLYLRSYKSASLPAGGDYSYSRYALRVYDGKATDNAGMLLTMDGGGLTIVGSGESATALANLISFDQRDSNTSRTRLNVGGTLNTAFTASVEQLILSSDNNIYFLTKCDTIADRKPVVLDTDSYFYPGTTKTGSIGTSSYMWNSVYAATIYENGTSLASKYAAIGHTHTTTIAADSGTNQLTLAASTKYKLTTGGTNFIFTTPPNTTYSAGTGLSLSGTTFNHSNSVTARTNYNAGYIKYDAQGHVTGASYWTATASGTDGKAGWIKIATIVHTKTYDNTPIMLFVSQRGNTITYRLHIVWKNANNTDPDLDKFYLVSDESTSAEAYIIKSATSTWDLYIKKIDSYEAVGMHLYVGKYFTDHMTWTWQDVQTAASAITGGTEATKKTYSTTDHTHSYIPMSGSTSVTGNIEITKASGDVGFYAKRSDTGVEVWMGVGSGGTNHGIYSNKLGKWMMYGDATNVYLNGNAINVTGTVAIANGGTGATTRLNALKNLTNENVGTSATYFLTITDSWGKGGYTSVANAKTVLGLKSAAYTESSAYLSSSTNYAGSSSAGGAANSANVLNYNNSVTATTSGLQYTHGSMTIGTADGNAKEGSDPSYKLWSYPAGGTVTNSTNANIQNLRLYWTTAYFRDIFLSPNNDSIYHRAVINNSAKPWYVLLDSNNLETYSLHTPDTAKALSLDTGLNMSPITRPQNLHNRSNKLALIPGSNITVEYSTDAGSNWTDMGLTADKKGNLFNDTISASIPIGPNDSTNRTTSMQTRITITCDGRDQTIDQYILWLNSSDQTISIDLQVAYGNATTTFTNIRTGLSCPPWKYQYILNTETKRFGTGTTSSYVNKIRFVIKYTGINGSHKTSKAIINSIAGYSGIYWGGAAKNNLMIYDHLYTWDNSQNATFPAQINATGGTITNSEWKALIIKRTSTNSAGVHFENNNGYLGAIGMDTVDGTLKRWKINGTTGYEIIDRSVVSSTPSAKVDTNWDTTADRTTVVTKGWMAYWNGAYNGTTSNLTYCNRGAFGTIVTKSTTDYSKVASSTNGKIKIDGTDTTVYTHPSHTSKTSGLYKITVDTLGHVSATASVAKGDIPALDYLPLTGGNVSGDICYKSTKYDGSAANNGASSGISYPTTFNILDKSSRILVRLEGVINSTGAIGSYWYVRNYNTSGTQVAQKGISMSMAKDGTFTYAVSDGANFRSAIGAGTSNLVIGTTATTAAAGNHTHGLYDSNLNQAASNVTTGGWSVIGIDPAVNGYVLKSIRINQSSPNWLSGDFGAGIAFGGSDTKGVISMKYDSPVITFAGGNHNSSNTSPDWYLKISGTSGSTYNLDNLLWATLLKPISTTTTASASTWSIPSGSYQVWGERFSDTRLKYTPSGGSETTITDTGDLVMWLTGNATSNQATLNMRIDGTYYGSFSGNLSGNASTSTKATQDGDGKTISSTYLKLSGGTMTGTLTAKASQTADAYSGALNMNNSNIYGVNAIYTADASDGAAEGIHFYRDTTHVDTLWMNGGSLLFVPNRELGTNTTVANSQKVARFTANPTTGQVVITDGTTGGIKSSGYTIAKSVPSGALFTDQKVTQSSSTTSDFRPLLLGKNNQTNPENLETTVTDQTYVTKHVFVQPSTGNLTLYNASGDSPSLIFRRGTMIDSTLEWRIQNVSGKLNFDRDKNESTETWENILQLDPTNSKMYFKNTEVSLSGHTHNYAGSSSAGGPATNVAIARVTKDSKVFPGSNKVVFEEYTNGTNYNLPSNHFYHIMSAQGGDTKYGTQLALGMTTTAAYYRSCNNQTWSAWKSIINSDTYDRNRYNANIKAGSSALVAANIIVGKDGVYNHLKSGGAFDITYPILYLAGAVDANGTTSNTYDTIHFTITTTQSLTLAAYRPVYIKGTLNGTVFTPYKTPLVQIIPTYDTYDYIYLGQATSSTTVYLQERHPIYSYRNGRVQEITPCASMAVTSDGFVAPMIKKLYDDSTTSTNYITISDVNIDDYEFFIICVTVSPKTDWEAVATQWIPARLGNHHFMINNGAAPSQGGGYIHCTDGSMYISKTGTDNKDLRFTLCRPAEAISTSGSSVTTDNFPNTRIMRVYGVKAL